MTDDLVADVEKFLRAARMPPRRVSPHCMDDDNGLPWHECLDCGVIWSPPLRPGCRRVRNRVHDC